jgi:hypothetical protein
MIRTRSRLVQVVEVFLLSLLNFFEASLIIALSQQDICPAAVYPDSQLSELRYNLLYRFFAAVLFVSQYILIGGNCVGSNLLW